MFIVLEGPDGAGTTLHVKLLSEKLREMGKTVTQTAEPTDGSIGSWIRAQLHNGEHGLAAETIQLMFCADRAQHIQNVIKPALDRGEVVVCDRYSLSTIAYGEASGVDPEWLKEINDHFLKPDITFLLQPSLDVCMERVGRRSELDMFEKKEFQAKVHASYKRILSGESGLAAPIYIDTDGEKSAAAEKIFSALKL